MADRLSAWRGRLDGLVTVLMLIVTLLALSSFLVTSRGDQSGPDLPGGPIALGPLMSIGDTAASVSLVVFSDFQCPFCARFSVNQMARLKEELVMRRGALLQFAHFPLDSVHPVARHAAEAVECSRRQLKEWQLHDQLFLQSVTGKLMTRDDVASAVLSVDPQGRSGIDLCLAAGLESGQVEGQVQVAVRLGVRSTPTFVIGRRTEAGFYPRARLVGAVNVERLLSETDRVLRTRQ